MFNHQYAVISTALATDNEIIAAVTGRRIAIVGLHMQAAGAVVATFKGGSTALSGAMTLATGVPVTWPLAQVHGSYWFVLTAGVAFNLTLGGTVQTSGHVVYELIGG